MALSLLTVNEPGGISHIINGVKIYCSGQDCGICKMDKEKSFTRWTNTIPFPIPPKGKKYKNGLKHKNRGKSIIEICYTCRSIPCWICRRKKCPSWMKESARKGQEAGCAGWEKDRCSTFVCQKGLVTTHWSNENGGSK